MNEAVPVDQTTTSQNLFEFVLCISLANVGHVRFPFLVFSVVSRDP